MSARDTSSTESAVTGLSRPRRRLFLAITILSPWLLLLLLELVLRLSGYGNDYPLFIPNADHPDYLVANPQVGRRYFKDGVFVPTPQLDFFQKKKEPGTFRIVFQGESSALGFPFMHGGAPSRMLEQRLQATFPDRSIEVINTALTAVNSYTLLDFADEIIAQHPDAVMIYTGHNEYYGAFGAGSARGFTRSRTFVRAYLSIRKLRVAQLVSAALPSSPGERSISGSSDAPRTVMELMARQQLVPLASSSYESGLKQFRANLAALLSRYRAHDIPVFIGTIASNERDQTPFVTGLMPRTDSAAWWRMHDAALESMLRGDSTTAERMLVDVIRMDSTGADAFYQLATIYDTRRQYEKAAVFYRKAKESDELRFRAPEAINAIIRAEAARSGAILVETQKELQRASPQEIVGKSLMLEHLHPNIEGYFLLANAFLEALERAAIPGPWPNVEAKEEARTKISVTAVDSIAGLFHTDRLTSGWPFVAKGAGRIPAVDTLQPHTYTDSLAQSLVLGSIAWPEAMEQLRARYEQEGDPDRAIHTSLAMAQEYRYSAQPYVDAARIEVARRGYHAALRYVLAAISRQETANTVQLAGLLLLRSGDQPNAMKYLERSVELAPTEQRMGIALRSAAAIPTLERRRQESARDTTVLYTLAAAYALTQQYEKARTTLADLEAIVPQHPGAKQLRQRLPKEQQ